VSGFRDDGFNDGVNGRKSNPPDPRKRFDGASTNVYAMEYREGYEEGRKCLNASEVAYIESKQPDHIANKVIGS
jgi:hypothetical protein